MVTRDFEEYANSPARDKVTPPVRNQTLTFAGVGFLISFALRTFLDWEVNPADAEGWWNALQSILIPAIPAITALIGSIRGSHQARKKVTPTSDPYLWDEASNSWQPAQVMARGTSKPGPYTDRPQDRRGGKRPR